MEVKLNKYDELGAGPLGARVHFGLSWQGRNGDARGEDQD